MCCDRAHAQRAAQARVVQRIIADGILAAGYVPIVLGDLNDEDADVPDRGNTIPDSDALSVIRDYDQANTSIELVNAASQVARQRDRYTQHYDKNGDGLTRATEPMTMLDHILIHQSLATHIQRVFIDHSHGSQMSDHWPVVVDLEF